MREQQHVILGPGEGDRHEARGSVMHFKATASSTNGRYSLMERTLPAGGRMPPPHVHSGIEEAYWVLDGEVTFNLDGVDTSHGTGAFVLVPSGTVHTFGNQSSALARLLVIHSPALDAYFVELEALWSGPTPPSREAERELMGRHGMRFE